LTGCISRGYVNNFSILRRDRRVKVMMKLVKFVKINDRIHKYRSREILQSSVESLTPDRSSVLVVVSAGRSFVKMSALLVKEKSVQIRKIKTGVELSEPRKMTLKKALTLLSLQIS